MKIVRTLGIVTGVALIGIGVSVFRRRSHTLFADLLKTQNSGAIEGLGYFQEAGAHD